MSITSDIKAAGVRYPAYVVAFKQVLQRHAVRDYSSTMNAIKSATFRNDMTNLSIEVMRKEGGKLTFAMLLGIIGAALGGVGIAALGGAIGIPLAAIGAFLGLAIGNEADTEGYTSALIRKVKAFKNG